MLWVGDDWVIFDFEGELVWLLLECRCKWSLLWDVVGMLCLFVYVVLVVLILCGVEMLDGWEVCVCEEFFIGYCETIDLMFVLFGSLMDKFFVVFEFEKVVYELRYELNNWFDWVRIFVVGVLWMFEEEVLV